MVNICDNNWFSLVKQSIAICLRLFFIRVCVIEIQVLYLTIMQKLNSIYCA